MVIRKSNTRDPVAPWTRFFLAGQTGGGKTTAAGTFPNPLFLVPRNENSTTTLAEQGVDAAVWTIESKQDMENAVKDLIADYDRNPEAFPYDTVAVESLTHYGDYIIDALTQENQSDMDQRKWGQFSSHLRWIHTRLTQLDVHLVFTSQAMTNEKSGDVEAMVQGRAKLIIPSACDAIGYCEATLRKGTEMVYTTHFRRYKGFPARTRYRWVPQKVENFDFATLYNAAYK